MNEVEQRRLRQAERDADEAEDRARQMEDLANSWRIRYEVKDRECEDLQRQLDEIKSTRK